MNSRYAHIRRLAVLAVLAMLASAALAPRGSAASSVPRPVGYYVLDDCGNGRNAAKAYATGLTSSPAYQQHITGHAIFVPIGKILPSITTWGQFNWNWAYMDSLIQIATANNKKFTIELEMSIMNTGTHYLQSLPANFASACGSDCAPLFDVWVGGAPPGTCSSSYILLPWKPKVQQFWTLAADSLAAHLHNTNVYSALTMVHVPGLSVYDEELRLPTGNPTPPMWADTVSCPDGDPAYPTCITDADTSMWRGYGCSDTAIVNGFKVIASAFAQAFPDRVLGLSLFPEGSSARGFPNFTADTSGQVASQLVREVSALAPGRVQLQADDLDIGNAYAEVTAFAPQYNTSIGWQSNKHNGTGATCAGDTCGPDGFDAPYYQLLQAGAAARGHYVEVWSNDVVAYPTAFAEADSAGLYSLADVPPAPALARTRILAATPNPSRGSVRVRFELAGAPREAELAIYDLTGRRTRRFAIDGLGRGVQEVAWDGRSDSGARAPAGVYYAVLREGATPTGRAWFVLLR